MYLRDQGINNNVSKVGGSRMTASVGVFNMAKRREAAMPAILVQLPESLTEISSPKRPERRGAHFAPCSMGTGDANLWRKAAGA
jgi:hypothetical protein